MQRDEKSLADRLENLAELVFDNVEAAARSLPEKEQDKYRAAQRSVVDARRRAETKEGMLRIR